MTTDWKYALASVIGTSHIKNGSTCQDASACRIIEDPTGGSILVAVVADGAGSATRAQEGAQLACSLFLSEIEGLIQAGGQIEAVTPSVMADWLGYFQSQISIRANAEGMLLRDYACTFLAAIVGPDESVFVQIGDGAIVISVSDSPDDYNYVYWPQKGEYENMTYFATDPNAHETIEFGYQKGVVEEVALFSDGIQRLALDFPKQEAHAPFFRPMFQPLRLAEVAEDGSVNPLSDALQKYLSSERINERTDDDKTLILATRYTSST